MKIPYGVVPEIVKLCVGNIERQHVDKTQLTKKYKFVCKNQTPNTLAKISSKLWQYGIHASVYNYNAKTLKRNGAVKYNKLIVEVDLDDKQF